MHKIYVNARVFLIWLFLQSWFRVVVPAALSVSSFFCSISSPFSSVCSISYHCAIYLEKGGTRSCCLWIYRVTGTVTKGGYWYHLSYFIYMPTQLLKVYTVSALKVCVHTHTLFCVLFLKIQRCSIFDLIEYCYTKSNENVAGIQSAAQRRKPWPSYCFIKKVLALSSDNWFLFCAEMERPKHRPFGG